MGFRLLMVTFFLFLSLSLYGGERGVIFLKVKKDGLNLRADSRVNSQLITKLKQGEVLVGVGSAYEWYKVRLPQRVKVYLYHRYVRTKKDDEIEVIADRVNVRSGPGLSYPVLGQANNGDEFKLCRHQLRGDWLCVLAGGHRLYGWVHKKGVQVLLENQENETLVKNQPKRVEKDDKNEGVKTQKMVSQEQDHVNKVKKVSQDKAGKEKEDLPIAKGVVREMGRILGVKYRYKLVSQTGKVLYYLSGDREMILPFVNKEVFVFGEVNAVVKDVPVLSVRKIALSRVGLNAER